MAGPEDSTLMVAVEFTAVGVRLKQVLPVRRLKGFRSLLDETKTGEIAFIMGIADKYSTFHEVLSLFANQPICSGCGSEFPIASCAIRKCCFERDISSCAECEEFERCTTTPEGFGLGKAIEVLTQAEFGKGEPLRVTKRGVYANHQTEVS